MTCRRLHLLLLAGALLFCAAWLGRAAAARLLSDDYQPTWFPARPGTAITNGSNAPFGAQLPELRYAPDGATVLIAYEKRTDATLEGRPDPWYVVSTNNGQGWAAPAPIYESATIPSVELNVAFDSAGMAHAVWVEGTLPFQLAYSRRSDWPNTPATLFSTDVFLASPDIVTAGTSDLYLTWSAINPDPPFGDTIPNIYFARSDTGGNSWGPVSRLTDTEPPSLSPSLAVGPDGKLNLVWEEELSAGSAVLYSQGTIFAGNVTWTAPITVSTGTGIVQAKAPSIIVDHTSLLVSFTNFSGFDQQWIYFTKCAAACTNLAAWTVPTAAQGQPVGANTTDPAVVNSEVASNGCAYLYYFGTEPGGSNPDSEIVWGINSCDGWGAGARDQVTEGPSRSIYPSMDISGVWMQLAYQLIDQNGRHIFHFRGQVLPPPGSVSGDIFLPIIFRR